jgi:hypothetical protein
MKFHFFDKKFSAPSILQNEEVLSVIFSNDF